MRVAFIAAKAGQVPDPLQHIHCGLPVASLRLIRLLAARALLPAPDLEILL